VPDRTLRRRASTDPQDLADEVSERRSRALEEPLDLRLLRREPYPVVEVRNPLHRTSYLVLRPTFPDGPEALCTCADFARRGLGTCKHIEAVDRWLRHHASAPAGAPPKPAIRPERVWQEIDRRLAAPGGRVRPDSLRWREAGASLYEPLDRPT